ncbi:MAG: acyl-ACP--UDP-N-acetylglucosamine O-acyltransferase [Planctomycetes bacterium]|nr:acyl-ACP--UDP-N-acetylglucosamine O-acyltransferase [Planctomycetota bacterium]
MTTIHPTAIVSSTADIASDCEIGPYAVIEDGVVLGPKNRIFPHAVIGSGTVMGSGNEVHFGAVIGHTPQHKHFSNTPTKTLIGNNNVFREHCQIHRSTSATSATTIGNNCLVMALAHVAHDCVIEDEVVICNNSLLAGHIQVGSRAVISGNCVIHQFSRIGTCAMVGGLSAVPRDVPPFMMAVGNRPCLIVGLNAVGLRRAGLEGESRNKIKAAFRILYRSGLVLPDAVAQISALGSPETLHLAKFVQTSKRGILAGPRMDDEATEEIEVAEG